MSPEQQLDAFIARFTPDVAGVALAVLARVRRLMPGAVELVYDNYNALVIGFGPSERASDAPLSVVVYPRWVALCFLGGAALPDPEGLLEGEGTTVRRIVLARPEDLDAPGVRTLIDRALELTLPWDRGRPARMEIRAVAAKQRPRRPGQPAGA